MPILKMPFNKRGQYGECVKRNRAKLLTFFLLLLVMSYFGIPKYSAKYNRHIVQNIPDTLPPMYSSFKMNKTMVSLSSITHIKNSEHFMVSAFTDHRINNIRIISIIKRDSPKPHLCICCNKDYNCQLAIAETEIHSDNFGYPFGASDVICQGVNTENANQVALLTNTDISHIYKAHFLPIKNIEEKTSFKYSFTVCISNLFGNYNNVLQFAQTMELYKLLGVQQVVIYNTSCGHDLEKLLQHYKREGILEIVPWPIDQFLNPSPGWNFTIHGGDLHYYGQLVTLNECIYRHMYQSKYVLLNDIDEIIMPYKHDNLQLLMEDLQMNHENVGVFRIENHIFPKTKFDDSHMFQRTEWKNIPGINIMEHIYREPDRKKIYNPTKMIINPRMVMQTSVHSTLKHSGNVYLVPFDVCRIVHVRTPLQAHLTKNECYVDTRVWDFKKELLPNVDGALRASGLFKNLD